MFGVSDGHPVIEKDGQRLQLTPDEAAQLLLALQNTFRKSGSRYQPIPTAGLVGTRVAPDAHHTSAVLIFELEDGSEHGFVASKESAKALRDALSKVIEVLESSGTPSIQ